MANIQIPNLPAVANLSGAELLEAVQAGSSVKVSLNQLNALFRIGPVSFPLAVDIGGTGTTTSTGTGSVVLSNNPVLVNPSFSIGSFGLGTVTAPSITFTGDLNTGIWSPGADTVAVSTGGVERMRIDSAGNVGIGAPTPSGQKLDVNGNIRTSGGGTITAFEADAVRSNRLVLAADASGSYLNATFGTAGTSVMRFQTANVERMQIDSVGNVGIGTATPTFSSGSGLEVQRTDAVTTVRVERIGTSANALEVRSGAALGEIAVVSNNPLLFSTNNTERMRITSGGDVGIGTAPAAGIKLAVAAASGTTIADFTNNVDANFQVKTTTGLTTVGSSVSAPLAIQVSNTERMRIDTSGNLGLGVTPSAWGALYRAVDIGNSVALWRGDSGEASIGFNVYRTATQSIYKVSAAASLYDQLSGQHRWFTAPSGTAGAAITFTQAMTLDASGNLLIGATSSPVSTSRLYLSDGTINSFVGYKSAGVEYFGTQSNHPVAFLANNIERYRIGTAGQLGIAGANFGTAGQAFISGGPSAATSWGTLGLAGGGTGATTAPAAAAVLYGYTETATAAGTTVLTNTSSQYQLFTGVTTQTITLPVTSTLTTGWTFHIVNASTGNLTINSSGGNLVATVIPGTTVMVTCILTSGTTAASWEYGYTDFNTLTGTGSVVMSNGATAAFALGAVGTPSITFTGDLNTGLWSPAADTIAVSTNGGERVRVHPSGGVSVGNTTDPGATNLSVTGTVTTPTVTNAGTLTVSATGANIVNVSTNSVVRQTYNTDGAQLLFQGAPTTIAAPATLTAAQIATGIIQYTGAVGNLTLPLASDLDIYYSANVNMALDFSIINTSAAVVTVAVNTGVTSIGALATAAGTSSRWRLRRTAVATWVIYRL